MGHTKPKISELAEVLAAGFDPSKVLNLLELKLFKNSGARGQDIFERATELESLEL